MIKLINAILLFVLIIPISLTNSEKNQYNLRNMGEKIKLSFVSATNLIFNTDGNAWEFNVKYYSSDSNALTKDEKYDIAIFYENEASLASCLAKDNSILKCIPDKKDQKNIDLVKINSAQIDGASIQWANLTSSYSIPQQIKLKYKRSYDLYLTNPSWVFNIEIEENKMPVGGLVLIDVFYKNEKRLASCLHQISTILTCEVLGSRQYYQLLEISPIKLDGSVEWEGVNLNKNISIPLNINFNTYYKSCDMEIVDNKWKFVLNAEGRFKNANSQEKIPNSLITVNVKIVKSSQETTVIANCFGTSEYKFYNCEIESENPNMDDLVYLTRIEDGTSTKWKDGLLENDDVIIRIMKLHFVKVYDLEYKSDKKWYFKIDVDDELTNGIKVTVDVLFGKSNQIDSADCVYDMRIKYYLVFEIVKVNLNMI